MDGERGRGSEAGREGGRKGRREERVGREGWNSRRGKVRGEREEGE